MPLSSETDERLAALASVGDTGAEVELITRYKNLVRARARTYFLAGADYDDVIQEGMMGLFKAIRDFDPTRQTVFKAFAELCVTRQIMTAVKAAARNKHMPLNMYVSLNRPLSEEDDGRALVDVMSASSDAFDGQAAGDPEKMLIIREQFEATRRLIENTLSEFEQKVLAMYLDGRPYAEIAALLEINQKSVDNALQRIKRKLLKAKI